MTGLFFALVAALVIGLGSRDQVLVAQLAERQGARPALLLVALASSAATAGFAAWGAAQVAEQLHSSGRASLLLAVVALGLAGLEMLVRAPRRMPDEPTHSLGAFALVILATQLTDATRFLIFAIALATQAPLVVGLGGAAGAMVVVSAGWTAPETLQSRWLTVLRRILGGLLLLGGLMLWTQMIG